ncbi:MAG: bifunctional riboflavin kinase/FAD synthetase [Bacteroidia bacterium]|nr:bifunctional riboflavin kinase/FAD synthetase [Bacteroidia bacterium]NND09940.1 bifunctional riboflavin kinase/FAD synthetase [Flavobacteriaceae bacterium]NNK28847.1 bifunctional riboflavin kinase/FAD synthetase [Flavobacteriaceae bacterium]
MKKIRSDRSYNLSSGTIVTIGTFDGVHIGHRKIIKELIKKAKDHDLESVLLTFFPHPRMVLQKDADIKLINTLDEKSQILENLGLDYLVIEKFTEQFSRITAVEFVRDILVNKLNAKQVIIGYNHRFGRNRAANINDLTEFAQTFDFKVHQIPAQDIDEVAISSTKIRIALNKGDIEKANSYLGYEFMLTGTIIKGKGLGKKIGFPTANLHIEEPYKLIPKNGVYAVSCMINDERVIGMMNIGVNPTVNGEELTKEVHLFDFEQDLYGRTVQVDMHARLRDEQKFDSINELKAQLIKDKEATLQILRLNAS